MASPEELQRREAERSRHLENKGRLAAVFQNFRTTGSGFIEIDKRVDFGLIYIEQPAPSWGHTIDMDAFRELIEADGEGDLILGVHATGYVTEWDRDEKGNYVGCWVAIAVRFDEGIIIDAPIKIGHSLTLWGTALKNVPVSDDD